MLRNIYILIVLLLTISMSLSAQQATKWSNGINIEDAEKGYSLKFGGIIMYDAIFYSTNDEMDALFPQHAENGTEFRRTRLYSSGKIYNNIKYKMQLDMAGGDVDFKDVYVEFAKVPVLGNLRVGQMKEPLRLEVLTSSKYITFIERAIPVNLQTERNSGLMAHNKIADGKVYWALGVFRNANGYGDDKKANGGYNLTGMLGSKLMEDKEQHRLIHLGAGFSLRNPDSDSYKVSARPESHLAEKYFDSGTIENIDNIVNLSFELALVFNRLSVQGEYFRSTVGTTDGMNEQTLSGYYAYASYFISGGKRPYKGGISGFGRVKPESNVGQGGKGAWEVALRYSALGTDLDSISDLNGITLGLNWYLNPGVRFMTNYVMSSLKNNSGGDDAKSGTLQFRLQLDF